MVMGDVLISLDDKTEKMLRKLAKERYGGKKGSLSEAVTGAIVDSYENSVKKRREAVAELVRIMKKGIDLGLKGDEKPYERRSDLYKSRFKSFD